MGMTRHDVDESRHLIPESCHLYNQQNEHLARPSNAALTDYCQKPIIMPQTTENRIEPYHHQSQQSQDENNSSFPYHAIFDYLDCILLFSCFRNVPVTTGERSQHLSIRKRQKVTIQVEATVVKEDRDAISKSKNNGSTWKKTFDLDVKLAESTFVGIVDDIDSKQSDTLTGVVTPTGRIRKGSLVSSIRKCATKARFVTMPAEDIIALSSYDDLDSGEIAAIVSSYLPAFGALYHGLDLKFRETRYSTTSGPLSNCEVLVSGGNIVEAEAIVKLALLAGASRIFAFQSKASGMNLTRMNSNKVIVLKGDPEDHKSRLHQALDVIIDLGYLEDIDLLKSALAQKGRLVCVVPRDRSKNFISKFQEMMGQAALIKHPGTSVYDFDDMCKSNYGEVLKDLFYLLDLTQKRKLRPKVDRYIKARDVEIMQEDMAIRPPRGTVICEPMRDNAFTATEPTRTSSFQERLAEFCAHSLRLEN